MLHLFKGKALSSSEIHVRKSAIITSAANVTGSFVIDEHQRQKNEQCCPIIIIAHLHLSTTKPPATQAVT